MKARLWCKESYVPCFGSWLKWFATSGRACIPVYILVNPTNTFSALSLQILSGRHLGQSQVITSDLIFPGQPNAIQKTYNRNPITV